MKAKELRIGNRVKMGNAYSTEVTAEIIGVAERFKPIPLTEEWLVRFGAYKVNEIYEYWEGDYVYAYELEINGLSCLFSRDGSCSSYSHIKYVHQIQNLYFAETGKELKVVNPHPGLLKTANN